MKKTIDQQAYEKVMKKLDRIDGMVTTSNYFIAFFCGFCIVGLLIEII